MTARLLVFTDLDGTLLDHASYAFDAARPALDRLRASNIPLLLASSKTVAEIVPLRAMLGFEHCEAIVENGAGLLDPGATSIDAATVSRPRLLDALASVPESLRAPFSGFNEWSLQETVERTGLTPRAATAARRRDFSEPGLWRGDAEALGEFEAALSQVGIVANQGGRFLTLSFDVDKAARMAEVRARYETDGGDPITIALGDAPNDFEMLSAADHGIWVPNPAQSGSFHPPAGLRHAPAPGPAGWGRALIELLDTLQTGSEPDT